ncbi:hypothetical protein SAMN05518672_104118 [Chitinophaga sp. CF118]|nr:hypothetical protein SAMN05518672_104118 [Chitinophaga sp. CF118]
MSSVGAAGVAAPTDFLCTKNNFWLTNYMFFVC